MRMIPVLILCVMIGGCAHFSTPHSSSIEDCADEIARDICKGLERSYMGVSILVSTPLEAVSLAPSDFSLALQELLIGAMAKNNANVVEVQLRREPYITCEDGFVSLSRDASRVRDNFRAEIILVSTYVARGKDILITSRAVDYTTNDVITSITIVLKKSDYIQDLIGPSRGFRIYER